MINDLEKPLKFLVGTNGSGKTYALNEALKEHEACAFLITEDGMPIIPRDMNKVSIRFENLTYTYKDESSRGKIDRDTEEELISEDVQNIVFYCTEVIRKLDFFKKKSKGQEKLYNMMNIFVTYNLNHIRIIYFDEPENYLDEEFLKVIADFFRILVESNFVVRIATHNARLLNILDAKLEDIIFFHSHDNFVVLEDELKELYKDTSNHIEEIRDDRKIQIDASIQYKLDLLDYPLAFSNFIEQNLKSEEFYRCLFYKQIIIVEGNSDIVALSSMKNELESSIELFNPNGKAFIPFFVQLFLKLKKEIIVIIDDDIPIEENSLLKHPVAITYYLKSLEDTGLISLVIHTPDLEGFYDIDLNEIGTSLGMSSAVKNKNRGWHKSLASFVFFREESNKIRLKNHVLGIANESTFEFE